MADSSVALPPGSPHVSVVLPTHNRPALLHEAVMSVAAQTAQDCELLIVDDGSVPPVDGNRWPALRGRLTVLRNEPARGGAASKTVGAAAARGELVAFLDDDDLFAPTLLERVAQVFDRHPGIDVVFLGVRWFGANAGEPAQGHAESLDRVLQMARPTRAGDVLVFNEHLIEALLSAVPMDFQRPVVRRAALKHIGHHRAECLMWDCDWAIRAALVGRCALLQLPLYQQRAEGQEYFSRPGRELAQMESAYEIALRLCTQPMPGISPRSRSLLRAAASRNAFSLAYFYAVHGPLKSSLVAWWASQRLHPNAASARLPLGAIARALRRWVRRGRTGEHGADSLSRAARSSSTGK